MQQVIGLLLHYLDADRSIRCIRSLLSQPISHVILWDNSTDGDASAAIIRAAFVREPRLQILSSDRNLGFAAGVNRGLEHCRALDPKAWVLLINNDAQLLPQAVALLGEALQSAPRALVASADIDHAGSVQGLTWCHRTLGLLSPRGHGAGWFPYASGCCLLLAMDRLELPLFDEDFFMYGEDCELGWRLARRQGALLHVSRTLVQHQGAASSGLGTPFYENHMVAAHLILARKLACGHIDHVVLHVARHAMLLARACVRSLRFRSMVPWKALCEGRRIAKQSRR